MLFMTRFLFILSSSNEGEVPGTGVFLDKIFRGLVTTGYFELVLLVQPVMFALVAAADDLIEYCSLF